MDPVRPKLTGSDAVGDERQGMGFVALSGDGGYRDYRRVCDNAFFVAAWVCAATKWPRAMDPLGNKMVGTARAGKSNKVILSRFYADSNTAIIGGREKRRIRCGVASFGPHRGRQDSTPRLSMATG